MEVETRMADLVTMRVSPEPEHRVNIGYWISGEGRREEASIGKRIRLENREAKFWTPRRRRRRRRALLSLQSVTWVRSHGDDGASRPTD